MGHGEVGGIGRYAEGRGMEHGQLPGVAEDQVETHRQHPEQEGEHQDGQGEIAFHDERQQCQCNRRQQQARAGAHLRPANRPAGLNSRMATRKMRP